MKCERCHRTAWRTHTICRTHLTIQNRQTGNYFIDARPAIFHLRRLRSAGVGSVQVSTRTGIDVARIERIRKGQHEKIRAYNAAKILAIPMPSALSDYTPGAHLPGVGTARRLRALQAMGYTRQMMAAECGLHHDTITLLMLPDGGQTNARRFVSAASAVAVQEMFTRLQMTHPPETLATKRARMRAQRFGWVLPLAWDEESIDDPAAKPQMPRDAAGSWYDDYLELKELGLDDQQIAARMGILKESLRQRLRRLQDEQLAS